MLSSNSPPPSVVAHSADPQHSARHIRRRLFVLLMQAFGMVVALTVVILVALLGVFLTVVLRGGTSQFTPQVADLARAYYLGHGSWEGVEAILTSRSLVFNPQEAWTEMLLVDATGHVLIDQGQTHTPLVGQRYTFTDRDVRFLVTVDDQTVGTLVIRGRSLAPPVVVWGVVRSLILPVGVISFFTGLLTLVIGFLLARRVVTPLADVIAAAHTVTAGDLSARVPVRGPGDLRSLSDSFNHMAETLERNDRDRRNWLADIAHELRTPLTVMRGKLEGMVDGVYRADEEHVAPVLAQTYVLERLVDDLRLLTLAEARQLHLDLKPVNLGELAHHAAGLFEAEADERGIRLAVTIDDHLPSVTADPQRVEQVIGNLVSNALRYIPDQGQINIVATHANGSVELVVSDNGPGVPEADLPRLFDRFWRGEKSRARVAGGAGLGLAIARQLVEAQGGTISAANQPGGGLRVGFALKTSA